MVCHIILMLCVGFIEEVIFRGFLFKAIAKDNVKTAIIISSVTFGVGHLVNLVNGSGMELVANLFQIVGYVRRVVGAKGESTGVYKMVNEDTFVPQATH